MPLLRVTSVALLAFAGPASALQAPPANPSLTFEHVTVVDLRDGRLVPNQTLVVVGRRITALGTADSVQRPRQGRVIDARGKYVIPGLWDMHVHAWTDSVTRATDLPLYIVNGLTGVRLMWGDRPAIPNEAFPTRAVVSRWQREIADGTLLGPRIIAASNIFDGPRPYWPGTLAIGTPEEGRSAVRDAKRKGVDFIKVYNGLPREAYFAIVDEATRQRLPVAGHVPDAVTAAEASDAGHRSIEHLDSVLGACSSKPAEYNRQRAAETDARDTTAIARAQRRRERHLLLLEPYDERECAALFARFVRNDTWQVPTLTVWRADAHLNDSTLTHDSRLEYMPSSLRDFWPRMSSRDSGPATETFALRRQIFVKLLALVGAMHRAGVPLLAGSDEPNPYVFPGFSLHDELALLVVAGLTPLAALRTATLNPARFLGATDSLGTVAPGQIADLVLLDADPLTDIRNTTKIWSVVVGGRLLDRAALDALLAAATRAAGSPGASAPTR